MTRKVALVSLVTAIGLCLVAALTGWKDSAIVAGVLLALNVVNVWVVWGERV